MILRNGGLSRNEQCHIGSKDIGRRTLQMSAVEIPYHHFILACSAMGSTNILISDIPTKTENVVQTLGDIFRIFPTAGSTSFYDELEMNSTQEQVSYLEQICPSLPR